MDYRTTNKNKLIIVGWKDNKSVYVASNCDSYFIDQYNQYNKRFSKN